MTFTVGVVGAGGISRAHGMAWRSFQDVNLVVYSLEGAEKFAQEFDATVVDTLEELLASCDLVDVITPTPSHFEVVEAALRAGKDVICEKPLCRTTQQARDLVALATELGRTIHPAHVVRYFPQYAAMSAQIADGTLGELAVLRFQRTSAFPLDRGWYSDMEASGGITVDLMIHDLDQATWLAGPVTQVYAQQRAADDPDPTQTSHVVLTHANGAVSHCRGLWGPQGLEFWYSFHVAGKDGMLKYDSRVENGFRLSGGSAGSGASGVDSSMFDDPYAAELHDFVSAWRDGTTPRVTMADGVTAIALAEAASLSAETGEPVDFTAFLEGSNAR